MDHCGCWRCMDKPCPKCEELAEAIQEGLRLVDEGSHGDGYGLLQDALAAYEAAK